MGELLEALAMAADAILHPFSISRSEPQRMITKVFVALAIVAIALLAAFTVYDIYAY